MCCTVLASASQERVLLPQSQYCRFWLQVAKKLGKWMHCQVPMLSRTSSPLKTFPPSTPPHTRFTITRKLRCAMECSGGLHHGFPWSLCEWSCCVKLCAQEVCIKVLLLPMWLLQPRFTITRSLLCTTECSASRSFCVSFDCFGQALPIRASHYMSALKAAFAGKAWS